MIAVFVYLGRLYNLPLLGFLLSIAIFVVPIFFAGAIKRKFLEKTAILDFDYSAFSVTLLPLNSDTIISYDVFPWQDMEAYRFYFDTKNNTCLTLYLKDKRKKTFIFNDKKTFEEAVKENSVFRNFHFFVKQLNQSGIKILPRPSLLATSTGKIIISFEIGLIIIAFIVHLINHTISNSYYLILGIALVIPQTLNRVQNKSVYEKLIKLDQE
jgi:hypothetical protein